MAAAGDGMIYVDDAEFKALLEAIEEDNTGKRG